MRSLLKTFVTTTAMLLMAFGFLLETPVLAATFNPSYIMPDSAFNASESMTASQIDSWINGKYGSASCISTLRKFKAPEPIAFNPPSGFNPAGSFKYVSNGFWYGGDVSAGKIIYNAAHIFGLNPKVILATLEKEQNLVSGVSGCNVWRYTSAMGYDCPDTLTLSNYSGYELYSINGVKTTSVNGTCVERQQEAGFSQQVIYATWQLKYNQQRSLGNVNWDVQLSNFPYSGDVWDNSGDKTICYYGYMTPGNRAAGGTGSGCTAVLSYDGKYTIDSTAVTMKTGATASLYGYTPHISGNTNFLNIFVGWFGNPNTACYGTANLSATPAGRQLFTSHFGSSRPSYMTYTQFNNTGSYCTEVHVMGYGGTSWQSHSQTLLPATNSSTAELLVGDMDGNKTGRDQLLYVVYNGPGGVVNIRTLGSDFRSYVGSGRATKLVNFNPTQAKLIPSDLNGDGRDQLLYVIYAGVGGRVNVRTLDYSYSGWSDGGAMTKLTNFDPSKEELVAGDFNGDGRDELVYVIYNGVGGRVNVRTVSPSFTGWADSGRMTPLSNFDSSQEALIVGDLNGDGRDELIYVDYSGVGGKVNFRPLNSSFTGWGGPGAATPLSSYDPSS